MYMLLVSDQTLFRDGIKLMLQKSKQLSKHKESSSLADSLSILNNEIFDLIVLDIKLKDAIGLDALKEIKRVSKQTPILTVTDELDLKLAQQAILFGSSGHISKCASYHDFKKAVNQTTGGHIYLSTELTEIENGTVAQSKQASDISVLSSLSNRQREVLRHLGRGTSNKAISIEMNISQNTVKAHLATIFKILGVHNRTEAFYFITRAGFPID